MKLGRNAEVKRIIETEPGPFWTSLRANVPFRHRYSRWFTWLAVPIPARAAIHSAVTKVSSRNRTAIFTLSIPLLARCVKSLSFYRRACNSSRITCEPCASR